MRIDSHHWRLRARVVQVPRKDWGGRRVSNGGEYCVRWYIAVSAEVFAQHTIVGLADFAFLDQTVNIEATEVK